MTEQELIVNWKDHCGALATECKSLLEKNFLVDCVLSAEGKKVKAHRLVLSASSPYFQMLFSEESEKYPIVFLKDTSFGSLKALVDFMYRGEAHIPEGDLQAFLALAKSLQIKGLNNDPVTNKKGNSSHNADGNDSQLPSEDYRETQEVQDSHSNQERSLQNSSQKPQSYQSSCDTDIAQLPFAPDEVCMDSSDTVQRVSPLQEEQIFVVPRSLHSEVTVKDEPLSFEFVGLKEDPTNMSENSMNEMHEETPDAHEEEDMNQYSNPIEQLLAARSHDKKRRHPVNDSATRHHSVRGLERLTGRHFIERIPPQGNKAKQQKRCVVCHKNGRRREPIYWCPECLVGLCIDNCFRDYHTKENYRLTRI